MSTPPPPDPSAFWAAFRDAFCGSVADEAAAQSALAALLLRARRERPLPLDETGFARHVAERLDSAEAPEEVLPRLYAGDLFLAYGCATGASQAIAEFDADFVAQLDAQLARGDALAAFRADVKQDVRVRLLAPRDGILPRIGLYRGRGPLGAWLRMTAARIAVELRRGERPAHDDEALPLLRDPAPDPELKFLKAHYRDELRAALEESLSQLPRADALLLRLYFLDGLSSEQIAVMNKVSSRTIQRRIAEIRRAIVAHTHARLNARFGLSETQLVSIVRLVDDELHLSVARLLGQSRTG